MGQINRRNLLRAAAGTLAAPAFLRARGAVAAPRGIRVVTGPGGPGKTALDAFIFESGKSIEFARLPDAASVARAIASGAADLAILPHDLAARIDPASLRALPAADLPMNALAPGMRALADDWRVAGDGDGALRWLPAGWRAEGIAWRADRWSPWGAAPSYADLWDGARTAAGSARGMLLGAGLHLEHVGALAPGALWAAHRDDAMAEEVWTTIEAWCAPRAARIRATAKGGEALTRGADAALIDAAAAAEAARNGVPLSFAAPQEGAMARMMGLVRPAAASDATLKAATAFASFTMARDGGMADWSGAEALMDPEALMSLHPLPPESAAHAARRRAAAARIFG